MTPPTSPMLPVEPGSYILLLRVDAPLMLHPGKLGVVQIAPGLLAYCGSALGPGGLQARVGRHLRQDKRPHWHIDALTAVAPIIEVWMAVSQDRLECRWAAALRTLPAVTAPAPRFGASDCRCESHLLHLPDREAALNAVNAATPDVLRVQQHLPLQPEPHRDQRE